MKKRRLKRKKLAKDKARLTSAKSVNVSDGGQLAKARAEARSRALQTNGDRPPNLSVEFVGPGQFEGDFYHRATCGEKEFLREGGESLEAFRERVYRSLPVGGLPKLTVFRPDSDVAKDDYYEKSTYN